MNFRIAAGIAVVLAATCVGTAIANYPDVDTTVAVVPAKLVGVQCPVTISVTASIKPSGWSATQLAGLTYHFIGGVNGAPAIVEPVDVPHPFVPNSTGSMSVFGTRVIRQSTTGYAQLLLQGPGFVSQSDPKQGAFSVTCLQTPTPAPTGTPTPSPSPTGTPTPPPPPSPYRTIFPGPAASFLRVPIGFFTPSPPLAAEQCTSSQSVASIAAQLRLSQSSVAAIASHYQFFCSLPSTPPNFAFYWKSPIGAAPAPVAFENCLAMDMSKSYVDTVSPSKYVDVAAPSALDMTFGTLGDADLAAQVTMHSRYFCEPHGTGQQGMYFR